MSNTTAPVRPEILEQFGNYFDSDDIDINDLDDLLSRAETVAFHLGRVGLSPGEIATPLVDVLHRWTPDAIDQFSHANNGFWDFDEQCEAALKAILERIVLAANGGAALACDTSPQKAGHLG